jgi:hypothetical protein
MLNLYLFADVNGTSAFTPSLMAIGCSARILLMVSSGSKNLIRPDSEASPSVGLSYIFMRESSSFHSYWRADLVSMISASVIDSSWTAESSFSEGTALLKAAILQRIVHLYNILKVAESGL